MQKNIVLRDHFESPGFHLPKQDISGYVSWKSPSNIAFIKYWGKYGIQLPKNASLSMTLSHAFTQTDIRYSIAKDIPERSFLFEGKNNEAFSKRILKFIDSLNDVFPFLGQLNLYISSENSFPHSAGIASSASAMSALALCLVDMEREIFGGFTKEEDFYKKASYIARLGSGSAARSIYGGFSIWGQSKKAHLDTDNKFAIPFNENIHPFFQELKDAILIVDEGQKKVSSSLGHSLMNEHPYADDRLAQVDGHLTQIVNSLASGDKDSFIKILESEAMSLHALMMSSDPWYMLMKPQTISIIEKIKSFREKTGKFICFTMDAGPNVHLIYNGDDELDISLFIEKELKPLCSDQHIIFDEMGNGPIKIN